jgi:hypothetical protein
MMFCQPKCAIFQVLLNLIELSKKHVLTKILPAGGPLDTGFPY